MMHGFTLRAEREIPEIVSRVRLWVHDKTGAEFVSCANADENKVFGVAFRTPPADSTGVAHILEHSVLCGSEKYPIKEPFVELLKGSLQTFLNAFTYPDKTCYPVASQNRRDLANLVDVYLDAVFSPRIDRLTFLQEGWHFVPEADGTLTYKGVVYNEMKGAYSSPDGLLHEQVQQRVFPDTTYGLDSGGDPARIPELTWENFVDFHHRYYHPSNARFWWWGDDDENERLRVLGERLARYDRQVVDSTVGLQAPFTAPRACTVPCAAGPEDLARGGQAAVSWLLGDATDIDESLAWSVLEQVLLGSPAAPLKRALIESGLGEGLAGFGLESELRQLVFSTGLKGIAPGDGAKVETLVLDELARLAAEGLDPVTVAAAVHTLEFRLREQNTGTFPRGLSWMLAALVPWLHGGDPFTALAFEAPLARLKAALAADPRCLEKRLAASLLDNPHRVLVELVPDAGLEGRLRADEEKRLAAVAAMLDADARRALEADAAALEERQSAVDPPEALAVLPRLGVADLDREVRRYPTTDRDCGGVRLLEHELATGGVVYVDLGLDLSRLPARLLPWAPLFGRLLLETGAGAEDYAAFAQRTGLATGGIRSQVWHASAIGPVPGAPLSRLFVRGKALAAKVPELADILRDALLGARLADLPRVRQVVLEEKGRLEQRLVPDGHRFVDARLRAALLPAGRAAEATGGIEQLEFVRALAARCERAPDEVAAELAEVRDLLVCRQGLVVNLAADGVALPAARAALAGLAEALPAGAVVEDGAAAGSGRLPDAAPGNEGFAVPAQVNYVGKGLDLAAAGYTFHGSALAVTRTLRTGYLWDRVRVQGGAYGAFCALDRATGTFTLVSYRDPNLGRTLATFDGAGAWLRTEVLSADEVEKAVVGAIGDQDAYLLPDAKAFTAMVLELSGNTDAERQRVRDELLATTAADFRAFGEALGDLAGGTVVVLGGQEGLEKAAADGVPLTVRRL